MHSKKLNPKWLMVPYFLYLGCLFTSNAQEAVPFAPRLAGGSIDMRGDIIFVGNSILNRATEADPGLANTPYNGTENNNDLWMEYIDIDGDPATFSSSSAELNMPDPSCSQVRYAGLYWAATYPNERSTDPAAFFSGTPRIEDWFNIKFKIPGGNYVDLTADTAADPIGNEDDIIFNGYDYNNINNSFKDSPYICYKNVTDLVRTNPDPSGEYTIANVRATKGVRDGSSSAGWVMVVIYENPSQTGKFISVFDGYAGMSTAVASVEVNVNGFKTLPPGFPVNARIGVGALEGDINILNDSFSLKANMAASFTTLSTTNLNPVNNLFNSTISNNDTYVSTRTPFGTNTLGLDLDIFDLSNPNNSVLPNNETGATMRFTSSGDGYGAFLAAFLVEQIEPNIVLEKRVEDISGNDITGLGVNLGQTLDYVLSFENIGNDDAVNYTIRDVLPINVTLDETNIVLPPGATYTFDAATRTIVFTIPNNLIEENDPASNIRMRVKVAENCYDFVDACSDIIQNLAYSTYAGAINTNIITDDPSVYDFDICGFVVPGASNFLLDDLNDCVFNRTVQLCGANVLLDAGDNFDSYTWVRDDNGNGLIDATDTVMNDGNPDNDPSTLQVNAIGTYIVDKLVADPCKGFKEIIVVEQFGNGGIAHPIIEYFNTVNGDADPANDISGEIVRCSIDDDFLPKIFLCGANDSANLQVNIVDAQSLVWEKLDETSCDPAGDDCGNKNSTCTWNPVATGTAYSVNEAGKYRLVVNYQNGCSSRFYFNVFQNNLDIQFNKKNILCTTPGNITITNLGNGYGYQLVNATTGTVIIPFSANNGPSFNFNPGQNGGYRVEVVQLDNTGVPIQGACIFSTPNIGILDSNVTYAVSATPASCFAFGSINIQINNALPNYEYEIRLDDGSNGGLGTLVDDETAQPDNNFTFENLNPGNYIAVARTADGCSYSEQVTVANNSSLYLNARVSQHITCKEGNILMNSGGGKTPHTYAIWSYVDEDGTTVISYPTVNDVPASAYQTSQIFDILEPGDYTFIVVDRYNCTAISNTVSIEFRPAAEYNPTSVIDVVCFGDASGSIRFNLINSNGYQLTYYLFDASTFDEENYNYSNALATNTSGNFPGLPAGDYAVVINQRKGSASCDYFAYHSISAPANALDADAVLIQEYTCTQDGIIEAQNITGGTAPYEYSIDGVNFFSGVGAERFTGLTAGTYTITVRDATGCTIMTDPITLPPLNGPTDLMFTSTPLMCPTPTSDVTVTVVGGSAPYTYEIIAPAADIANNGNNPTFAGLSPKTYTFQVTDVKGCTIQESYTITPPTPINVIGQLDSNISCFGLSDGAVTFYVTNFSTSYDYAVTGPLTFSGTAVVDSSIPLTGLAAGTYNITVTDTDTNCTATTSVTVAAPPSALIVNLAVTEISCSSTGAVIVSATGGWGGYEYELEDPSGTITGPQANNTFTGLTDPIGNYTVTVRDAGGCEVIQTFSFTPSPPPLLEVTANNLCYDSTTGLTLTANVLSGGTAPFQYRLNGGAYQSSNNFTGLGPGSYTVEVIDSKNCTDTAPIEVYPTLTASSNLIKGLDCSVSPDAAMEISIADGNPNYTYEVFLDGSLLQASTPVPPVIPFPYSTSTAGTYTFSITDNEGCTVNTSVIVDPLVMPIISLSQTTDILCNGDNGGTILVDIDGTKGVPPYSISVVNITTATAYGSQTSGLPAGVYEVTVTDAMSCPITETITITEPDPITYDIVATPISCDPLNGMTSGSIGITNLVGGTAEYTYYLTGNNGYSGVYTTTAGGENHSFTGLDFGIYQIDVVDANGCAVTKTAIIDSPPGDLTITVGATTLDCSVGGTAEVTVNSLNGSGNYQFAILETFVAPYVNDPINDYKPADTPGGDTATFTGLIPGVRYTFVVRDGNGCYFFATADLPIDSPSALTTSLDAVNNVTCTGSNDGSISFTFDNYAPDATGVNYEIFHFQTNITTGITNLAAVNPPSVGSGVTVTDLGPLAPGVYYILFNEVGGTYDGCSVASEDFTISESINPLLVTATLIKNDNCNLDAGQVSAIGQFGTAPYEYQIALSTASAPTIATWAGNSTNVFNVEGGDWIVYIKDANNCIRFDAVTVPTDPSPEIDLSVNNQCSGSEGNYAIDITLTTVGIAPYAIRVDGGAVRAVTGLATAGDMITISGLNSGNHTVEILDMNGCGETKGITIAPELQATAIVAVQPSCTSGGVIEFTINGGSGSYLTELLYSDLAPTGISPTGNQFVGVPFGDYVVRVTDNIGTPICVVSIPVSLEEPTPVTLLDTDPTDVSCSGASDGSIVVTLSPSSVGVNDNPPYVFEITNGTATYTQSTGLFTGLTAGVWDITVTSNRNCIAVDQVIIGEPTPLAATITNVLPFVCDPNNAPQVAVIEVSITAGTGTPDYFYSVNGGSFLPTGGTVFTYEVLSAGDYDIIIRDANGCLFPLPTQPIDPLNTFTAAIAQNSAISCAGAEEILISVTDDGNPANSYSFELLPLGNPNGTQTGFTNTTATYNLTAVGNYTFRITDNATGCYIDTAPYDIAPYDLIDVLATATSPVSCFGDGEGALEINITGVTGYSGAYGYEVFTQVGASMQTGSGNTTIENPLTIDGLSGGNYYVRVTQTEFPFCSEDSNVVTIVSPSAPLTAIVDLLAEAECTNDQGEILIDPIGGYAPYDIVLTNTTTGQVYSANDVREMLFTGLSSGNFEVLVTDNIGCDYPDTTVLAPATPIVANAIPLTTMLACYGENNATVTAIVTGGGSGNYEYQLNYYDATGAIIEFTSGEQTSSTFTGLGIGIYSITVTDGWNCDVETNKVGITQPPRVFASLIRTAPLTCATGVEFELTATGGSGTYEYSADNVTFLPMTSNPMGLPATGTLGAGMHQYYVRDALNGCLAVASNGITEDPIEPLILVVDRSAAYVNCTGENMAVIRAGADGGMGNYQYELYLNSVTPANRVAGPQSEGVFSGLGAGTYWVNAISEDCMATPQQVIIDEPIPLTYTDQSIDISCFGEENGSITVTLSGGAGGYIYSISPNLDQFDTINTFTDLAPGNYAVIAQDQKGCFEYLEYTISEPAILEVNASTTPEICAGSEDGTIRLSISGGTAPYSTSLNSNANSDYVPNRMDFSDLPAGQHLIFVRDAQNCETNINVTIDPGFNLRATVVPIYECTGNIPSNYINITLEDQSVLADVLYALDTTDPNAMQLNPDFRDITPGDHYIAIAHENGCMEMVEFNIQEYAPLTLTLEKGRLNEIKAIAQGGRPEYTFYLNGIDKGADNTFHIVRTGTYEVRVVDRNGCEAMATIYMEYIDIEMPNFFTPNGDGMNDFWMPGNAEYFPNMIVKIYDRYGRVVAELSYIQGWDGTYKGNEVPTGDYWYVVHLNEENDKREFVNHFTLYR